MPSVVNAFLTEPIW